MKNLEAETTTSTTKKLLEQAIEGFRSQIAKLHIAAFQEVKNNNSDKARLIAYQSEIIQNAVNSLKELREKV